MYIRDWLCEVKVGRLLLSCDARPRMKSRYWLSCVRRGIPLRTSFGYRPLIGCIFDWSVGQDLAGRRGDLFSGIVSGSVGRESRLRTVGCVVRLACLAI